MGRNDGRHPVWRRVQGTTPRRRGPAITISTTQPTAHCASPTERAPPPRRSAAERARRRASGSLPRQLRPGANLRHGGAPSRSGRGGVAASPPRASPGGGHAWVEGPPVGRGGHPPHLRRCDGGPNARSRPSMSKDVRPIGRRRARRAPPSHELAEPRSPNGAEEQRLPRHGPSPVRTDGDAASPSTSSQEVLADPSRRREGRARSRLDSRRRHRAPVKGKRHFSSPTVAWVIETWKTGWQGQQLRMKFTTVALSVGATKELVEEAGPRDRGAASRTRTSGEARRRWLRPLWQGVVGDHPPAGRRRSAARLAPPHGSLTARSERREALDRRGARGGRGPTRGTSRWGARPGGVEGTPVAHAAMSAPRRGPRRWVPRLLCASWPGLGEGVRRHSRWRRGSLRGRST